ncbi:MAG: response regulator [Burkholderiaceae bacterium]
MTKPNAEKARLALVADDHSPDRDRLSSILVRAGWRVAQAKNGLQAVARAKAGRPEIIFMDIMMPEMDGFQACRRLIGDESTRGIPVVFVSTKSQRADQIWARAQGGRELIAKPFASDDVLQALKLAP